MRPKWLMLTLLLAASTAAAQQTPAPVLFFSDLTTGPATGNSDTTYTANGGAYVTLYGNFFGTSQGASTITLNGTSCLQTVSWGKAWLWYQKIVVQLTNGCSTGNFLITVGGQSSNGLPFTVTPGNIYFVSTGGSDSNSGTYASPWQTVPHAVQTAGATAGSITYLESGVSATTDDGQGWEAALTMRVAWCGGTSSAPTALVAYPGATVQIGLSSPATSPVFGIRGTDSSAGGGACTGNWTIAGIDLRGIVPGFTGGGSNWRWIGNDITNPAPQGNSIGEGGAFETSESTNTVFYGNYAHNLNGASTNSEAQGIYFSSDSNGIDMGWNEVANVAGCRGVQIHSSPIGGSTGLPMYNISIHDNTIHDTLCDAVIVDTFDANEGPVSVYNNVVYNGGTGPTNPDGGGTFSCINVQFTGDANGSNAGTAEVFGNTTFACGTNPDQNENEDLLNNCDTSDPSFFMHIRNNIAYSVTDALYPGGIPYTFAECNLQSQLYGVNNLFYGARPPPANTSITATVNANPEVNSTTTPDLHLMAGSPAIGAGSVFAVTPYGFNATIYDHDGLVRPSPPSIGAYEFSSGGSTTSPTSTATTLTASAPAISSGQSVTFTATVTPSSGTVTPAGTVTFTDGTTALGTSGLNGSGVATLTTTALTASGSHSITASYSGNSNFVASTSAPVTVSVSAAPPPNFQITLSSASGIASAGAPAMATVTITPQNSFSQAVTLSCGGLPSGASCTFSPSSVTPKGGAATSALSISVTASGSTPLGALRMRGQSVGRGGSVTATSNVALSLANLLALMAGGSLLVGYFRGKLPVFCAGRVRVLCLLVPVCAACFVLLVGCAGTTNTQPVTPNTQTVTIAVTGTSGALTNSTSFTLTTPQ